MRTGRKASIRRAFEDRGTPRPPLRPTRGYTYIATTSCPPRCSAVPRCLGGRNTVAYSYPPRSPPPPRAIPMPRAARLIRSSCPPPTRFLLSMHVHAHGWHNTVRVLVPPLPAHPPAPFPRPAPLASSALLAPPPPCNTPPTHRFYSLPVPLLRLPRPSSRPCPCVPTVRSCSTSLLAEQAERSGRGGSGVSPALPSLLSQRCRCTETKQERQGEEGAM